MMVSDYKDEIMKLAAFLFSSWYDIHSGSLDYYNTKED